MASIVVNQGIEEMLDAHFGLAAVDAPDAIGVSDFGALSATTTSIAAATNSVVKAFTAGPSRTNQTVSMTTEFTSAEISGFTITTITLHNDGAGADTGVQAGVDGQSLGFSGIDVTLTLEFTVASA